MTGYCFDTDIVSVVHWRKPSAHLLRRLARAPAEQQFTTTITLGELLYGAARTGNPRRESQVCTVVTHAYRILSFDRKAAEVYGPLRARLERAGRRLDEPDLRIASIALSRGLTLVTANVRHFGRVPDLSVENWLERSPGS